MVEGVAVGSIKCCGQGKLSGVANVGVGAGGDGGPVGWRKKLSRGRELVLYY